MPNVAVDACGKNATPELDSLVAATMRGVKIVFITPIENGPCSLPATLLIPTAFVTFPPPSPHFFHHKRVPSVVFFTTLIA